MKTYLGPEVVRHYVYVKRPFQHASGIIRVFGARHKQSHLSVDSPLPSNRHLLHKLQQQQQQKWEQSIQTFHIPNLLHQI